MTMQAHHLVIVLGCVVGCANTKPVGRVADPFLGDKPAATVAQPRSRDPLEARPTSGQSRATAALAASLNRPLTGATDELRIGSNPVGPPPPGLAEVQPIAQPQQAVPWLPAGRSVLQTQPLAANGPPPGMQGTVPSGSPTAPQAPGELQQLKDRLDRLGAREQRLERWGETGQWRFTCSLQSRTSATALRRYDAREATEAAAVRAVLAQIEQDRQP